MAITATYDSILSRIQLAAGSLGASATYAVFDRTTDGGITYTTIRGGYSVAVSSQNASIDDYEFPAGIATTYRVRSYNATNVLQQTFTVANTTDLDAVWMKVPAAPFLNRKITVSSAGDRSRPARRGVFDIIGRSKATVVSDIRSSSSYDIRIRTFDRAEEDAVDYTLQSGEILFFHLPSTNTCMRGGYYSAGDASWGPPSSRSAPERIFTIPLLEANPPDPVIVASAYTWTSVPADYASWTTLMSANATWSALLARTGTPSDVIVP
jgi:hypothetical protein